MTSLSSLYITGIPTTSADIADQLADETGSGALVFSNSPTFTGSPLTPTPTLASQVANKSYVDAYTFRKVEIGAISSGITAELFTHYAVDTTAGAVTVNLPAGSPGARIAFSDPAGNFSVNSLTLVPNGSETIVGVAPLELNTDLASVLLYWHTSLGRWCFETAETTSFTNPTFQNGVCQFVQTTKPTERSAGVALVAGDRWYKTDDQTEWSWNGTYWLSPRKTIETSSTLTIPKTSLAPVVFSHNLIIAFAYSTGTANDSNYTTLTVNGSDFWAVAAALTTANLIPTTQNGFRGKPSGVISLSYFTNKVLSTDSTGFTFTTGSVGSPGSTATFIRTLEYSYIYP